MPCYPAQDGANWIAKPPARGSGPCRRQGGSQAGWIPV